MNQFKFLFLSFNGRIGRQSYWIGVIAYVVAAFIVMIAAGSASNEQTTGEIMLVGFLILCYPGLAISAKRWHDRNKSGWWSLIGLVPVIGGVWMLVENGFLAGTAGPNRFGPPPAARQFPVKYEGQTYFRARDGSFADAAGNPIVDATLVAALGAAFVAVRQSRSTGGADWGASDWSTSDLSTAADSGGGSDSGGDFGGSD